ncbi:DUF2155 domain-containing protein [Methylocapsa sp. S129]|uniref:DUF2155 domain-containing protein n=1 Tax=Methylocapsa sp. S129 TaxID=1641869 RepID=UPI00131D6A16|nr:DUF2155 domain-containing protein [Methylocapsa sp. S129]
MNAKTRGRAASIVLGALLAALPLAIGSARADKIKHPTAVFEGLDKITGRIISFEAAIDETVQFGSLQITPRVCYTRPPTEAPRTDVFVEVDEVTEKKTYDRIFSGWMFAASPGLHGIEHPVYDIWLTDCKGGTQIIHEAPEVADAPDSAPTDADPANASTDPKIAPAPAPAPKKRKPPPKPIDSVLPPSPLDLNNAPPIAPSQRGGIIRRFFPTDDPPIPPGNVGQ